MYTCNGIRKGLHMDKRVIYYENIRGRRHAEEFINTLDSKTRAKVLARIEYLGKHWHELGRPLVDKIKDDLYELRIIFSGNQVRIIYAYMFKDYIVLLHGFIKKRNRIPKTELLKAEERMINFQRLYMEGKIKLKNS